MTKTDTPAPPKAVSSPRRRSPGLRRLRRTIGIAFACGAAHATGTGLIGLLFWWITHR
ncbi:hypothetical protein GCM10009555_078500 [Acrocarpospora macrocephala]|uniref:Uncharacterized protein n=1 Tax=Acrocarpospora macrocephala TaxID=150177 RepID=A0A5M3X9R4_9ACTN|nr:hypothetical protein [Acrocarpospora macrocephala]GES16251.1 hypothetical protein Amac_098490 [Acrocarpospora macrocephala]